MEADLPVGKLILCTYNECFSFREAFFRSIDGKIYTIGKKKKDRKDTHMEQQTARMGEPSACCSHLQLRISRRSTRWTSLKTVPSLIAEIKCFVSGCE